MIKPIAYHDIREKKKLEAAFFDDSDRKKKAISHDFIFFFPD